MRPVRLFITAVCVCGLGNLDAAAQTFRRGGTEFHAVRPVIVPAGKSFAVIVTEFFHHGQIAADGRNVMATDQHRNPVPTRVLQLGPGDFCRVAFQTVAGQSSYEICYGGEPPAEGTIPTWNNTDGLMLETREYKDCNLNDFESVRKAFDSSQRIGSGYVDAVHQACNPFTLAPGPFLSHYWGTLRMKSAGTYGLVTSSQDCSFLLIDGKMVASAPGRHGPTYRARPGTRHDVQLTAGSHQFDYYHAAAGPNAMMMVAWAESPGDAKTQLTLIPSEAFRCGAIGHIFAGPPATQREKLMPDFLVDIGGDVPLPESDQPLIGVQFANTSPQGLKTSSRAHWDFGDGQTSEETSPAHVYLRPGLYTVTLKVTRGGKSFEIANKLLIDRPQTTVRNPNKLPKLDDYLPVLQTYDPRNLDGPSLLQFVRACQFKADLILAGESDIAKPKESAAETASDRRKPVPEDVQRQQAARPFVEAAVNAGKLIIVKARTTTEGDEPAMQIARTIAPMARDVLGNAQLAGQIWHGVSQRVDRQDCKAECEIAAADIAANDLANAKAAKMFLETAQAHLGQGGHGPLASRLQRVWGDYYALTGDGSAAQKAYREAQAALGSTRRLSQQTAWEGAHSRSTEAFLREGKLDRAVEEIRHWEDQFPTDKISGCLTLAYARYWAARGMHDQVVAMSEQLLAVNRESPYADQVLLLAAQSELQRGRADRALATLQSLVKDYPGSPLVPDAKKRIAQVESGNTGDAKPRGKPPQ